MARIAGRKFFPLTTKNALSLLVIPFILFILLFSYVPILGWSMAFVRYIPGIPILENKFIGLKNFETLFSFASDFPRVITNTLAMSFLGILCSPIPIVLALLLDEVRNTGMRRFMQTMTSLPNFISMVIVYSIFFSMFAVDDGLVNNLLLKLGVIKRPLNLLGDASITWYFQTFVSVWKSAGWGAIMYLAALSGIDQELMDAAKVDGAGRFRQVIHIKLPGLIPTYIILLLLSLGNMLSGSFEQIYVFYNPLVSTRIETLDYYTYRIGLGMFDFSFSTAIGMFKSVISVILLFVFNRISRKLTGSSVI
jgi:ABC-type polysaccharide transport system permease subunit